MHRKLVTEFLVVQKEIIKVTFMEFTRSCNSPFFLIFTRFRFFALLPCLKLSLACLLRGCVNDSSVAEKNYKTHFFIKICTHSKISQLKKNKKN